MLMTFPTLVLPVRQCQHHALSGPLEKISICIESLLTKAQVFAVGLTSGNIAFSIKQVSVICFCC